MAKENKIILKGSLIQVALGLLAMISGIAFIFLFIDSFQNKEIAKDIKTLYLLGSFFYLLITIILIALYIIIEKIRDIQKQNPNNLNQN